MTFAIAQDVAAGLIKFHLSGFRGYPKDEAGVNVFARCIQECCVSVDHAVAVLKLFTEEFPTLKEIITTATNLRLQFEPTEDQRKEWERKYGPAAPVKPDFQFTGQQEHLEMWAKLKAHFVQEYQAKGKRFVSFAEISWREIYEAQEKLGYPLNRDQLKMLGRA